MITVNCLARTFFNRNQNPQNVEEILEEAGELAQMNMGIQVSCLRFQAGTLVAGILVGRLSHFKENIEDSNLEVTLQKVLPGYRFLRVCRSVEQLSHFRFRSRLPA